MPADPKTLLLNDKRSTRIVLSHVADVSVRANESRGQFIMVLLIAGNTKNYYYDTRAACDVDSAAVLDGITPPSEE